jgi:hypothetical protein
MRSRQVFQFLSLWPFIMLGASCFAASQPSCVVDLAVYGPRGDRTATMLLSVNPPPGEGVANNIDFLTTELEQYRMSWDGNRLHFPEALLGRTVMLTLQDEVGRKFKTRITFVACQQRTSVVHGQLDSGADVGASTITGRISGCKTIGDWWIRATPMFGSQLSYEGRISQTDGTFHLTANLAGERYIIVIGKDKEPLKVLATDVVIGGKNEMGVLDLTGVCPKGKSQTPKSGQ